MNKIVGINNFVKRQTPESQFTHFDGTWEELSGIAANLYHYVQYEQGYRPGVIILHVYEGIVDKFFTYTDFPMFEGMRLEAVYERVVGRESEPPQLQVRIGEPKIPCKFVDLILYSHEVLLEDDDASTDCEWEIVSINGRLEAEAAPMAPLTIVRNWKHLTGGTEMKGKTPEEVLEILCESISHEKGM